jgi:hypothetical protein
MTDYYYDGSAKQNTTFSTMVNWALANKGGPRPTCTQQIDVMVRENEGFAVPIDGTEKRFVAINLQGCAAVIFASAESATAYIYHAVSGVISKEAFDKAMQALGGVAPASVYVIYTFPKESDQYYVAEANKLVLYGIPAKNVIYAPELPLGVFGITSQTILG